MAEIMCYDRTARRALPTPWPVPDLEHGWNPCPRLTHTCPTWGLLSHAPRQERRANVFSLPAEVVSAGTWPSDMSPKACALNAPKVPINVCVRKIRRAALEGLKRGGASIRTRLTPGDVFGRMPTPNWQRPIKSPGVSRTRKKSLLGPRPGGPRTESGLMRRPAPGRRLTKSMSPLCALRGLAPTLTRDGYPVNSGVSKTLTKSRRLRRFGSQPISCGYAATLKIAAFESWPTADLIHSSKSRKCTASSGIDARAAAVPFGNTTKSIISSRLRVAGRTISVISSYFVCRVIGQNPTKARSNGQESRAACSEGA